VLIRVDPWEAFRDGSLWIEALCACPRKLGQRRWVYPSET
jgi:hypothetical protein